MNMKKFFSEQANATISRAMLNDVDDRLKNPLTVIDLQCQEQLFFKSRECTPEEAFEKIRIQVKAMTEYIRSLHGRIKDERREKGEDEQGRSGAGQDQQGDQGASSET